jgi:hypothetical protein
MGKRELGLILAFVVAGVIVWQVTAPEATGPGFSLGNWLNEARREVGGRRASAEVTSSPAIPMDRTIAELRLTLSGEVTIRGENRQDVAAELRVVSNGFDEAEARQLAGQTALKVSRFADSVVVGWSFPDPGTQRARLLLRVPSRLRVQIDGRGTADITGVDAVTLARAGGSVKLTGVAGLVKGESRAGDLTIDGAETIDLSGVSGESTITGVRGDIRLNVRGGEVRIVKARGRLTIAGTDTRVRVDGSAGELRAEMAGEDGDLELNDVAGAVDIDTRNTPVIIGWLRAAPAKIQVRDGSLELALPQDSSSYSLDMRAAGGDIRVPAPLQKTTDGGEIVVRKSARADAPSIFVRGVGATLTIR